MTTAAQARALVDRYGPEFVVEGLREFVSADRARRIEGVLDDRLTSVSVVLEDLYDAHNGAAAIRSIESFGLTDLHVVENQYPFRFSSGVAIGCEKWISTHRYRSLEDCVKAVSDRGMTLYATLPDADHSIEDVPVDRPIAVVFGNEHEGLSDAAVAACSAAVTIPMYGFTQSFNLSVSVALVVERLAARRRQLIGASGDLEAGERAFLRARWYALSVRGAEQILARHVAN